MVWWDPKMSNKTKGISVFILIFWSGTLPIIHFVHTIIIIVIVKIIIIIL